VLTPDDRTSIEELAPVLRRTLALDPRGLARLRLAGGSATALVLLPFGVLVSRTVETPPPARVAPLDLTARAADIVAWLDAPADDAAPQPERRDHEWRTGLPPASGWRRVETVPDDVIRSLVRAGALALKDAATREGVPGAQPRGEVADALLDSIVLTVTGEPSGIGEGTSTAEVSLRAVSALTRMGFLPRGGRAHIDVAGRWVRVVAKFGTVYLERPGQTLGLA
jgi:hypothetical protein